MAMRVLDGLAAQTQNLFSFDVSPLSPEDFRDGVSHGTDLDRLESFYSRLEDIVLGMGITIYDSEEFHVRPSDLPSLIGHALFEHPTMHGGEEVCSVCSEAIAQCHALKHAERVGDICSALSISYDRLSSSDEGGNSCENSREMHMNNVATEKAKIIVLIDQVKIKASSILQELNLYVDIPTYAKKQLLPISIPAFMFSIVLTSNS